MFSLKEIQMRKVILSLARWRYRFIVFVSLIFLCINCIDPYTPNIDRFESLLVVDALITDEDGANYVKLTRSSQSQGEYESVGGAVVAVSDDSGNSVTLEEKLEGEYWTDPSTFRGEVGRSYVLSITTPDGDEYVSDPCLMYPATGIDSLYYGYYEAIPEGYSDSYGGVNIYIDTPSESASGYRRWIYDEWWKFKVPYPVSAEYINKALVVPVDVENEVCWSHVSSSNINVHRESAEDGSLLSEPIVFIPSQLSSRFQIQYSIEVRQLSISRDEYDFWSAMKLLNDSGGDIFDKQPFSVSGNVRNVNHPSKNALGYFQVSAVDSEQVYITENDIWKLGLWRYLYDCERLSVPVEEYYSTLANGYTFVSYETFNGALVGLFFVLPACADCTLSGQLEPPDFWEDLK